MGPVYSKECILLKNKQVTDYYSFSNYLGSGYFGKVYRGVLIKDPKHSVAIKIISKQNDENKSLLSEEIDILKTIEHPNIVKLFEVFEDDNEYYLVMEYCDQGDLFDRISARGCLSEQESKEIIKKILGIVEYLHSNLIAHRDIKPENFLFKNSDIKLIDFGFSKKIGPKSIADSFYHMHSLVGTAQYLAPEVLRGKYDKKCDMWSVGVLAYFMLSGTLPFASVNNKESFKKILKGQFNFPDSQWKNISSRAKRFICQLLNTNPKSRLSANKALSHKWFMKKT